MPTIEVDGRALEVEAGQMLIQACDQAGIYIPRFCYHDKLSVAANCRMCLVEVEKAPKPLPACATPVTPGMVVKTRSALAQAAQQATLEFLLINHPLDCPVCDQGGECPLQDQALGYGNDASRFDERKRVVPNQDLGPLIATEMTRCIHCTRCVRFGEEVAGIMEMGAVGRGEGMLVGTFLDHSVDSEVSGNMIDLCPVGALTSKPYRFAARAWELDNHRSISPHDCVGTNINIQTLRNQVERVLPINTPSVNDCWLADRDRYSYTAMNGEQRLTQPLVKGSNGWQQTSWEAALQHAAAGLKAALDDDGSHLDSHLGCLAAPTSTLEEFFLLQKLSRALGSDNVDFRLQQNDFRDDAVAALPCSELPIADYANVTAALLVGANIRKEQPLLSLRLRTAVLNHQARISSINLLNYPLNFALTERHTCNAGDLLGPLAALAVALGEQAQQPPPQAIADLATECTLTQTPGDLLQADAPLIIVGANAQQHGDASAIKAICEWLAHTSGARLAILPPANSVAGYLANCRPSAAGLNAAQMLAQPRRAYLLLGSEPEYDCLDGRQAMAAMQAAQFVVQLSAFDSDRVRQYADVLLPMAGFAETAGTYVNCEGRAQAATAATAPKGAARPAWKILRVLGNFLDLPDFDYVTLADVRAAVSLPQRAATARMATWQMWPRQTRAPGTPGTTPHELTRLADMPMYRGDATLRNAAPLQQTADNPPPAARLNHATQARLELTNASQVRVSSLSGGPPSTLTLVVDARVPTDCVYIPAGYAATVGLGGPGPVSIDAVGIDAVGIDAVDRAESEATAP